jgi:hypothetical protein
MRVRFIYIVRERERADKEGRERERVRMAGETRKGE